MDLVGLLVGVVILLLCAIPLILFLLVITMFNQQRTVEWFLRQYCSDHHQPFCL